MACMWLLLSSIHTLTWARFLLGELHVKSLKGKTTVKAMRAALKKLPVGYDDAYKDVMVRIKGQGREKEELAEQVLSWIACAERPLTILELQYALAVEVGESELDKDNLREIEDIISVCSGLVTIDKASNVIRLVHYTAQEFFERTQSHWFQNANTYITTICTTYLSFDAFERGLCQTEDEFENRLRSNNFFEYAAQNWGHHARKATTLSQALSHAVVDFLMSEAKVDASSQGLLGINSYLPYSYHNQNNPRKMTGLHLTAYFGAEAVVKLLLKTGKVDGDSKDNGGRTSLSWAAQNGHEAIVKLLLGTGKVDADSKDDGGWTPLSWAAGNGQEAVVKLLFATGKVDADSKDKCNETPLSWAAGNGHEAIVKLLLATDKVDANSKDDEGWTPRSHAAQNGHETIVKLLQARELRAMT